jgi:hypothetical protein
MGGLFTEVPAWWLVVTAVAGVVTGWACLVLPIWMLDRADDRRLGRKHRRVAAAPRHAMRSCGHIGGAGRGQVHRGVRTQEHAADRIQNDGHLGGVGSGGRLAGAGMPDKVTAALCPSPVLLDPAVAAHDASEAAAADE